MWETMWLAQVPSSNIYSTNCIVREIVEVSLTTAIERYEHDQDRAFT